MAEMDDIDDKIEIIHKEGSLNEEELGIVRKLVHEYAEKIQRMIKNFDAIEVHVKVYEKTANGKIDPNKGTKKFSINSRVYSDITFKADHADWNLARTVHRVMTKLMNEIEHKFHVSNSKIHDPQKVRKTGR